MHKDWNYVIHDGQHLQYSKFKISEAGKSSLGWDLDLLREDISNAYLKPEQFKERVKECDRTGASIRQVDLIAPDGHVVRHDAHMIKNGRLYYEYYRKSPVKPGFRRMKHAIQ